MWSSPSSPDRMKKRTFIRHAVSENEIKLILQSRNWTKGLESYADAIETLIDCSWSPSEEHIQRYDRFRATPIEHDDEDEDKTVHLASGKKEYLQTRSTEDLQRWLTQHHVTHKELTRKQLIKLVKRVFATTTPVPAMPRFKLCPRTSGKHNTVKMGIKSMRIRFDSGPGNEQDDEKMSLFGDEQRGTLRLEQLRLNA